jgi:hypothetical protein
MASNVPACNQPFIWGCLLTCSNRGSFHGLPKVKLIWTTFDFTSDLEFRMLCDRDRTDHLRCRSTVPAQRFLSIQLCHDSYLLVPLDLLKFSTAAVLVPQVSTSIDSR